VKYYGFIAHIAARAAEEIDLPENSKLMDLITELVTRYGPRMEQLLLTDTRELKAEAALLINGRNALYQQGIATPLHKEDNAGIVLLVPFLKGG
jgi:molybdopterin converting factor small subunit